MELRQAINKVRIEGILAENDLKYGSYEKNGKTVENINGTIKVLVEQEINGEARCSEVPINVFVGKLKNDGTPNPAYASIEKVLTEFKSIASTGSKTEADKVRINGARLQINSFPTKDGRVVSEPRIVASFINRAYGEFVPDASFELEFMVKNMHRRVDTDGVECDPPITEVEVCVPQYGGRVDVMTLLANTPATVDAVELNWIPKKCYAASGRIEFSSKTETIWKEQGFGEKIKSVVTSNSKDIVITGGSIEPLENGAEFSFELIQKGLEDNKLRIEALKNNNKSKQTPSSQMPMGARDLGF